MCEDLQHDVENNVTEVKQLSEKLFSDGISISQVVRGSIVVKFRCKDHAALTSLQELYVSKRLNQLFNEAFRPQFAAKGLEPLKLHFQDEEFQRSIRLKLMTPEHREALLSSAERLLAKTTVSSELLDKLSLCKCRREVIEQAATHEQHVKTLIDIVSRQPDCAFTQLLNALRDCSQHEAAAIISDFRRSAVVHNEGEFHEILAEKQELQLEAKLQAMEKDTLQLRVADERLRKTAENEGREEKRLLQIRTEPVEKEQIHVTRVEAEKKTRDEAMLQAELEALKAENDRLKRQVADSSTEANKKRKLDPEYASQMKAGIGKTVMLYSVHIFSA